MTAHVYHSSHGNTTICLYVFLIKKMLSLFHALIKIYMTYLFMAFISLALCSIGYLSYEVGPYLSVKIGLYLIVLIIIFGI